MLHNKKNKKYKIFKYKCSIAIVYFIVLFLAIIFINNNSINNIIEAATTTVESSTNKPRGYKVENAQYYDYIEEYDKSRIIIVEGEGNNGEGGGSSGSGGSGASSGSGSASGGVYIGGGRSGYGNNQNSGIGGSGSNASGVSGQGPGGSGGNAASGNSGGGMSGSGNSSRGGNSYYSESGQNSNAAAIALRKSIEESRQASIAAQLATAADMESVKASIAQRESIQASIQERLKQESIKARVFGETAPLNTIVENRIIETIAPPETIYRETTTINMPMSVETNYNRVEENNIIPEANTVATTRHIENNLRPTSVETTRETVVMTVPPTTARNNNVSATLYSIQNTFNQNITSTEIVAPEEMSTQAIVNEIEIPTAQETIRQTESVNTQTFETFDAPIVEQVVNTEITEKEVEPGDFITTMQTITQKETNTVSDTEIDTKEEGKKADDEGEAGGKDNNDETIKEEEVGREDEGQDKLGKEDEVGSQNELESGIDSGEGAKANSGMHKNIKILEIDTAGAIGFNKDEFSMKNLTRIIWLIILAFLFILGIVLYILPYVIKTKNKTSYF